MMLLFFFLDNLLWLKEPLEKDNDHVGDAHAEHRAPEACTAPNNGLNHR